MLRLRLVWIGKPNRREAPGGAWSEEYERRIRRYASLELEPLTPARAAAGLARHAAAGRLWLFDPAGRGQTSPQFAAFVQRETTRTGKELVLALGGAEGFPPDLAAAGRISLSPLTFSHELARVMVLEQIYRALTLLAGHPYAK